MPQFNRFDIMEAYYLWLSHNHGGQGSDEYARLSRMTTYFRPRPSLEYETLEENGQAIYDNLDIKSLGSAAEFCGMTAEEAHAKWK